MALWASVLQATVSWPCWRGDLMLDIEVLSGTNMEHLPHARLWASNVTGT